MKKLIACLLAASGFLCTNLKGGTVKKEEAGMPVTADTYEVDVFRTKSGKTVRFHALMHASIRSIPSQLQGNGIEVRIRHYE